MARVIRYMTTVNDIQWVSIPKISDPDGRGNLSVIEKNILPYAVKRVYYLYDVPSGETRGGHAHIALQQCLIAVSGSFDVVLYDGSNQLKVHLNKPDMGLIIPNGIWRELENFSSGSVCLALVSEVYIEEDYIRDYHAFETFKSR